MDSTVNHYDPNRYLEDVQRTESNDFDLIKTIVEDDQVRLDIVKLMHEITHLGIRADLLKRRIFYAKSAAGCVRGESGHAAFVRCEKGIRLTHAIAGMMSELGEMAQDLVEAANGHGFDTANAVQEAGDLEWYWAIYVAASSDVPLHAVLGLNISKLRMRYPKQFGSDEEARRDKAAERALFEEAVQKYMTF